MKSLSAMLAASATCPMTQLQGASRSQGNEPWTHPAYCIRTAREPVCVYTDADFHFGQGISVVARSSTAAKLVASGLLDRSVFEVSNAAAASVKYEALQTAGSGTGLFVKAGETIRAGERVLVDYPTLVNGHVGEDMPREVRRVLQWRAVLQLPRETRRRSRALARSNGVDADEIDDVLWTNSFTHEKADAMHDVLFTEAAVSDHSISIQDIWRC